METEVINNLEKQLVAMYELFKRNNKNEFLFKIERLMNKVQEDKVSIAFCGHFSAGKSSFINELFGKNVLPTSPIPTSANIVYVKRGDKGIDLYLHNGQMVQCPSEISLDEIKNLCKDGEEVKSIYYHTQEETFSNKMILIDTPGVDSVDEAHALATAEVIHECDYIIYVMDYNHVSARTNLDFLKDLTLRLKKVTIVINQIDKHNEEELSFDAYKKEIEIAIHNEGIIYENLFFTSLKRKELEGNDLQIVKDMLKNITAHYKEYIESTIKNELNYLLHQAFSFEEERNDLSHLYEKNERLKEQLETEIWKVKLQKQIFKDKVTLISKNAYIMTPELREVCKEFIQSQQKDFKVGLLFTKEKTVKEKERRKEVLWTNLRKSIDVNLYYHYVNEIREIEKEFGMYVDVEDKDDLWTIDLLENILNEQAIHSEQYVMKYCQDLSDEIKKIGIKKVEELVGDLFLIAENKGKKACEILQKDILKIEREIKETLEKNNQVDWVEHQLKEGVKILEGNFPKDTVAQLTNKLQSYTPLNYDQWRKNKKIITINETTDKEKHSLERRRVSLAHVENLIECIKKIRGLTSYREILEKKLSGLQQQQYVLALFGAFSAGKSSFANALLGAPILPSSPNPTTATVIKIQQGTSVYPSGTVQIVFKSEELLLEEWSSLVGKRLHTMEEIKTVSIKEITNIQDQQYAIRLKQSYGRMEQHIGKVLYADLTSFQPFVRDEEIASYVKEAVVYYDSPITKQGIVLVDTPGADSVYGRHTNVSFRFMKDSDGILFVTYYNHAFSKSDREVLIQLGKMKELSSLESMYFIINAIDLAQSEEEKETVYQYVSQQLLQYGISQPKVWMTSSMEGLKSKKANLRDAYGFYKIEDEILRFVKEDLNAVAINDLYHELMRTRQALYSFIQLHEDYQLNKEEHKRTWENHLATVKHEIKSHYEEKNLRGIELGVKELFYYIEKRLSDRFTELFLESFNPTTIRKGKNIEIEEGKRSFYEVIGDALYRDLQVTGYRIEKMLNHHFIDQYDTIIKTLKEMDVPILLSLFQRNSWKEFEFSKFQRMSKSSSEMKQILKKMSNTKWYFEGNGKKEVMNDIKEIVLKEINGYLKIEEESVLKQVTEQYRDMIEISTAFYLKEAEDFVASFLSDEGSALDESAVYEAIEIIKKVEKNSL